MKGGLIAAAFLLGLSCAGDVTRNMLPVPGRSLAFLRLSCEGEGAVFFRVPGFLRPEYRVPCANPPGKLQAIQARPGLYEMLLVLRSEEFPRIWTANLFEAEGAPGRVLYWGDIHVARGAKVRIAREPDSLREFQRRSGTPISVEIPFAVSEE